MSPFASVYGCVLVTTSALRQTLKPCPHWRLASVDRALEDQEPKAGYDNGKNLVSICLYWTFKMHEIWTDDSQKIFLNCCHQMSDFKAKMHQVRFRLGLCPRPRWGAYSAPVDLLAGFKGPTSKRREGMWWKGRKGLGLEPPPKSNIWLRHWRSHACKIGWSLIRLTTVVATGDLS